MKRRLHCVDGSVVEVQVQDDPLEVCYHDGFIEIHQEGYKCSHCGKFWHEAEGLAREVRP